MSSGTSKRAGGKAKGPSVVADAKQAADEKLVRDAMKVILHSLDESKAEETVSIDITGKSALADAMIVTSGRSHRHVGAIAERLVEDLKAAGVKKLHVEGLPHCDWVLVDTGDAIVHIFRPEVRGFYNLEKMWQSDPVGAPQAV